MVLLLTGCLTIPILSLIMFGMKKLSLMPQAWYLKYPIGFVVLIFSIFAAGIILLIVFGIAARAGDRFSTLFWKVRFSITKAWLKIHRQKGGANEMSVRK
jgi:hypothetical protein